MPAQIGAAIAQAVGALAQAAATVYAADRTATATEHAADQDLAARDLESQRQLAATQDTNRTQLTTSREDRGFARETGNRGNRELAQLFDSIDQGLRTDGPSQGERTSPRAGHRYHLPEPARAA